MAKASRRLIKRLSADQMPPDELLRHPHWVSDPHKFYGGCVPEPHRWGNYLRGVREYFVITPDLGMVLIIKQNKGEPGTFYYHWGHGRLPNGVCMIKASETMGVVLTSLVAMYAPPFFGRKFEDFQPFIDTFQLDVADLRPVRGREDFAKMTERADKGFEKFHRRNATE